MFSAIRRHFSPAMVLAFVALVFAVTGGAFAATGSGGGSGGGSSHATLSASVAKAKKKAPSKGTRGPAGPKGATGATGATGPAGPVGATGPAGAAGGKGENGAAGGAGEKGSNGANGKSVLSGASAPSAGAGEEGDFYIRTSNDTVYGPKSGSGWGAPTELKGQNGQNGSPWSPDSVLPQGATETGAWTFESTQAGLVDVPLASFAVKLPGALPEEHYHVISSTGQELIGEDKGVAQNPVGACPGSASEPEATEGNLCVYLSAPVTTAEVTVSTEAIFNPATGGEGPSSTGAYLWPNFAKAGVELHGTWAVTAE